MGFNTYLGKGLREPCSPYRTANVFGARPNEPNADNWNCNPAIVNPITYYDLSAITKNREVTVALVTWTGKHTGPIVFTYKWYRKRDNKRVFSISYERPRPPTGAHHVSAYSYCYLGWVDWEIAENGDYYVLITASADTSINKRVDFRVTGIPLPDAPPPGPDGGGPGPGTFNLVGSAMNTVAGICTNMADRCESIWYIGEALAVYFDHLAYYFKEARDAFYNLQRWGDDVASYLNHLLTWGAIISAAESRWGILTKDARGVYYWISPYIPPAPKLPSYMTIYVNLRSYFESGFSILRHSWGDVTRYVDSKIAEIPSVGLPSYSTIYLALIPYFKRGFDILSHHWSDVTDYVDRKIAAIDIPGLPPYATVFANIKSYIESTYSIVTHRWTDVTAAISNALDALPDWTKKSFSSATDEFIDAFQRRFAASKDRSVAFLAALGIGAGDVITTILDTPRDMFLWLRAEIENAYDIVDHTWSEVKGEIELAIKGLSDIVDHTWSEVTEAISTAIAGLSDIVEHPWSEVTEAISTAIAGLSDIVDHTWSEVTGYADAKTDEVKAWFDGQEEKVYGWISEKWVDKILDIIDAKVDKFKDKIWNLIEKIVEKL